MPNIVSISDPDIITRQAHVDADGKLLVAGSFSGGGDGAIVDGASAAIKATVVDGATANPLLVSLTDQNGDAVSAGGGTQYTEDAAAAANPIGNAAILVRADTLGAVTTTDGDNVAARGTNKGELYVKHVDAIPVTDNGGALTVDGTVTANLAAGTNNIGDVDVLSIAAGDNNIGNVDIVSVPAPLSTTGGGTEAAALRVTIASDSTGVLSVDDNGGALTVDGTVTANLAAGTNNIGDVDVLTIPGIVGTVADDATTPGNPVMVGGQAVSPDGTDPGSVAEADVVRFKTDLNRRLYVATNHPRTWRYHLNTSTAQTDTQIQAAPGAGLRVVITNIQFTSGAATAINLFLEESTTNIWGPIYLEAVAGRGYVSGPIFLPITANTAVTYTTSAAIAQAIDILGFIEAV